ncbi:hypothetical protein FOL47_001997 [Perkinsus chesapeaki]|uniref:Uncharacterized protein n=1 Tax=Perkinsus chesapeaki TaxID=330153 RepID=A0A7J6MH70_PERCH|nr:hypothetical protein FOL47_001997 [Perkinsus chesapeaki]
MELEAAVEALSLYDPEIRKIYEQMRQDVEKFREDTLSPVLACHKILRDVPHSPSELAEFATFLDKAQKELGSQPMANMQEDRESIRVAARIVASVCTKPACMKDVENLSEEEEELLDEASHHLRPPQVILAYHKRLEDINGKCCAQLIKSTEEIDDEKAAMMKAFPNVKGQLGICHGMLATSPELLFPELSEAEVSAIVRAGEHIRLLNRRRRTIFRRWREERLEALHATRRQYHLWAREEAESVRKIEQKACALAKAQILRERLDDALADKRAREAGMRLELEELAQVEAAREKAEMAKRSQYEAVLRAKVETHRKVKAELEQIRVKEEAAARRAEKERKRRNRPLLAARVAYREKLAAIQAEERQFCREVAQLEVEERKLRIQRAIEKFCVRAEADESRLTAVPPHKNTEGEHPLPREIFERYGYGVDDLEKDPRYRLQAALFDAGLFMSKSGHNAMISMIPEA